MSQERTLHTQPDKKNGQKPASTPIIELLSEVTGVMETPVGSIARNRDSLPVAQARLQTVQRQWMAKQVGRVSGNRYMQQVFSPRIQTATASPLLQRAPSGWSDATEQSAETSQAGITPPKDASWNEGKTLINHIWRIPVEGLTHGNTSEKLDRADRRGATPESAVGKAIVLQHKDFKKDSPARVLLHFHGFGAGYRQLEHQVDLEKELQKLKKDGATAKQIRKIEKQIRQKRDYAQALQPGQVRDVDLYRIEQQLDALQDPQMMAVLPQGTSSSGFGDIAKKPAEYLDEVLGKLQNKPGSYHIVLSGHSGGGPTVTGLANKLAESQTAGKKNSQVDEMILFDAINSDGELGNVQSFLKEKLKAELAEIKSQPKGKQKDWIEKNGFRFRGYHSGSRQRYQKKDANGDLLWADPATKKKPLYEWRWVGYGRRYSKLDEFIRKLFQDNTNDLPADVRERLESNYQVFQVANTSHEKLMGSTRAAEKGKPAPSQVGVLHEALSALPGQSPAAAPTAPVTAPRPVTTPTPVVHAPAIPQVVAPPVKTESPAKKKEKKAKKEKQGGDAVSQAALSDKERARLPELKEARKRYKELDAKGKKLSDEEKTEKKALGKDLKEGGRIFAKAAMEEDLVESGTTVQDWFRGIVPQATFMDIPIRPSGASAVGGVHRELLDRLEIAEKNLMDLIDKAQDKKPAFSSKREYADNIGLYSVNGLRLPGNATGGSRPSMHCYGLAVDVNYVGNPFVGNAKKVATTAPEVIKRATLLIEGKEMNVLEKPGKRGALEMWDRLSVESEALKTYFSLRKKENEKLLGKYIEKSHSTRTVADWQRSIAADYAAVYDEKGGKDQKGEGKGDFGGHKDPAKSGFMDLDRLLVQALTQAGLFWGGQYNAAKDIMHFDWRKGTIKR